MHGLFGRYQAAEPLRSLARIHFPDDGVKLKEVDHEPKVAVLDQSDLDQQGIDVSTFIPGASRGVTALGSCTANATIEALSNKLSTPAFASAVSQLGRKPSTDPYKDVVAAERGAIGFYHLCTSQTADTATEWPPTDCGSSGPYIVTELERLGLIRQDKIAHDANSVVSLMQSDGVLIGMPWLAAWMEPDARGFLDGDGKLSTLEAQLRLGVAGGHEIYGSAIEKLTLLPTGHVDPFNTVVRIRNHWRSSWGDHGSARFHLSTLTGPLGQYIDIRQLVV